MTMSETAIKIHETVMTISETVIKINETVNECYYDK